MIDFDEAVAILKSLIEGDALEVRMVNRDGDDYTFQFGDYVLAVDLSDSMLVEITSIEGPDGHTGTALQWFEEKGGENVIGANPMDVLTPDEENKLTSLLVAAANRLN